MITFPPVNPLLNSINSLYFPVQVFIIQRGLDCFEHLFDILPSCPEIIEKPAATSKLRRTFPYYINKIISL